LVQKEYLRNKVETVPQTMSTSVWGGYLVFYIIVRSKYLKIKNSKNCPSLVFIFLGDLKNRWGPGLRKPKRSSYDQVRGRVRVCD
jgi:hypothetical protein